MKRLLIVGAGGFGREIFHWLGHHPESGSKWRIGGFLDDNASALGGFDYTPGIVGSIKDWLPGPEDIFVCALGQPKAKRAVVEQLRAKGARFLTFIAQGARLGGNISIGEGSVICPGAIISADIKLGEFVTVNMCSTIGHDARLANFVTLNSHCDVTGFCQIGTGALLGTHACMIPHTTVGEWSVVGAGATVFTSVAADTSVIGNPARVFFGK